MNAITRRWQDQQGVTLVEVAVSLLVLGLMVVASLRVIDIAFTGSTSARNALRARNLAEQKLEDMKELAANATFDHGFGFLTLSAQAQAYSIPNVTKINDKTFTWRVAMDYMLPPNPYVTPVPTPQPVAAGNTSTMIRFISIVDWDDKTGAHGVTLTGYVTDYRQYQ